MEADRSPEVGLTREDRVRALGFDPDYLTEEEQAELIELHSACPDDALGSVVARAGAD